MKERVNPVSRTGDLVFTVGAAPTKRMLIHFLVHLWYIGVVPIITHTCFSTVWYQELMKLAMMGADAGNREGARQTLGDVLVSKPEAEFVRPRHTVREAARVMASQKKAVLVVEQGVLEGIFTPRDMLNRVIAKVTGIAAAERCRMGPGCNAWVGGLLELKAVVEHVGRGTEHQIAKDMAHDGAGKDGDCAGETTDSMAVDMAHIDGESHSDDHDYDGDHDDNHAQHVSCTFSAATQPEHDGGVERHDPQPRRRTSQPDGSRSAAAGEPLVAL